MRRASELDLSNCFEMSVSLLLSCKDMPDILGYGKDENVRDHCLTEMAKCLIGRSKYTFASLGLAYLQETRAMMSEEKCERYVKDSVKLRQQFIVSQFEQSFELIIGNCSGCSEQLFCSLMNVVLSCMV